MAWARLTAEPGGERSVLLSQGIHLHAGLSRNSALHLSLPPTSVFRNCQCARRLGAALLAVAPMLLALALAACGRPDTSPALQRSNPSPRKAHRYYLAAMKE